MYLIFLFFLITAPLYAEEYLLNSEDENSQNLCSTSRNPSPKEENPLEMTEDEKELELIFGSPFFPISDTNNSHSPERSPSPSEVSFALENDDDEIILFSGPSLVAPSTVSSYQLSRDASTQTPNSAVVIPNARSSTPVPAAPTHPKPQFNVSYPERPHILNLEDRTTQLYWAGKGHEVSLY